MKLAEIMEVTGYSKGHCSTIRAGTWTPRVSTWPALARVVGLDLGELAGPTGKPRACKSQREP